MGKPTVLLVDDDPAQIRIMGVTLRNAGYQITVAQDGVYAIQLARKQNPDVILLDLGLPAGDGFSVLQRLKSIPNLSNIPVIVLSARDVEPACTQALQAGAEAFFQKPADLSALFGMIQKLVAEANPNQAG